MSSPPRSARARKLIGATIGEHYKVLSMLGEGAMGEVFLVEHTSSHKRLALKLLNDEMGQKPEAVARFEREALAAANIHHPNVAAAIDSGHTSDGALFVVYEYAEGQSLYERIVKGRLPTPLAVHITRQVASALVWAHAIGVVHRDIKAENIVLVAGDGVEVTAKVLDFGLAKVSSELLREGTAGVHKSLVLTRFGTTLGTPAYMAPEQALGGAVDARTDLYSLGVLLYEMLTGSLPFECAEPAELLRLHLTAPVPPIEERVPGLKVPPELEAMVLKLLEKEPEQRFQSAKALVEAIDSLVVDAKLQLAAAPTPSHPKPASPDETAVATTAPLAGEKTATPERPPTPSFLNLIEAVRTRLPEQHRGVSQRTLALSVGAVLLLPILILAFSFAFSGDDASDSGRPGLAPDRDLAKAVNGDLRDISKLANRYPTDPRVMRVLARAHLMRKDYSAGMRAFSTLVRLEPMMGGDPEMLQIVTGAALMPETSDAAIAMLESQLGDKGVAALSELAERTTTQPWKGKLSASLQKGSTRALASEATLILLDLRAARRCEDKRTLLKRAGQQGDARTLSYLQAVQQQTTGCGPDSRGDCWDCMRKGTALQAAMDAIVRRIGQPPLN